jgi:HK97 family phage portal protein
MPGLIARVLTAAKLWLGEYIAGRGAPVPADQWGTCAEASVPELLTLAAVNRAIACYSDPVAALPRRLVRRVPGGGVEEDTSSDAARVLSEIAYTDLEGIAASAVSYGNGYALIERNERGGAQSIGWIASQRVTVQLDERSRVFYRVAADYALQESERLVAAANMLHVKFRATGASSRYLGRSPLAQCANSLAGLLRVQEYQREITRNIKTPATVLKAPGNIQKPQLDRIKTEYEENFGKGKRGSAMILSGGMSLETVNLATATDSQLNEQCLFGIAEVARAFGVPLSLLQQPAGVGYASSVEETRSFASLSLQPFCARIADELGRKLLTPAQRVQGFAIEFDLMQLLVSPAEMPERVSKWINGGFKTVNEARNEAGLPDVEGGDELRVPVNTMRMSLWRSTKGAAQAPKNSETPDEVGDAIEESARKLRAV